MSGEKSVILDAKKGEARFGEDHQRMVLVASKAFVKMMEVLNAFGTAGFTMFYMIGHEKGYYDILKETEALRQQGFSFTKRLMLQKIVQQLRFTGWGAIRIQKYDEKQGVLTIVVENNPLVVGLGKDSRDYLSRARALCHYFRGYWVSVSSEVFKRRMNCVENKCMGMGDAYCEFEITVSK